MSERDLVNIAEEFSLFVLSMLEFSNKEGRQLIFERNTDERIIALVKELQAEERGEYRERIYVWEASPELKKANALKQMLFLIAMVLVLLIVAIYRYC